MKRIFNKIFYLILSFIIIQNVSIALNSEYQNSLVKVELLKTGENSFNVELYTQKKFDEPIKVIKKSDLNYYILLPETKNSISNTATNSSEIRSITSKSYNYAGQDVENGYTKVNINTTKPIAFRVNVRNVEQSAKAIQKTQIAQNQKTNSSVQKQGSKVQKKNSYSQSSKKNIARKPVTKNVKKQVKKAPIAKKIKKPQVPQKVVDTKESTTLVFDDNIIKNKQQIESTEVESTDALVAIDEENVVVDRNIEAIKKQDSVVETVKPVKKSFLSRVKSKLIKIKSYIKLKLNEYGMGVGDVVLMFVVAFISFIFMYIFLNKKSNNTKIKSKSDLIGYHSQKRVKTVKPNNDGKYFIFDDGVKQTGLCRPTSSPNRKRFELSSYKPEKQNNLDNKVEVSPYISSDTKKDLNVNADIIHKILSGDSYLEKSLNKKNVIETDIHVPTELEDNKIRQTIPLKNENPIGIKSIKEIKIKEVKEKNVVPPVVMSKVEIAPERGFMCVSYDNNINLMGYIFDDVYAIYNFKQPKLENYDIKYRLSEKEGQNARFIVKIADVKMMIKVTKSSMFLEVLM